MKHRCTWIAFRSVGALALINAFFAARLLTQTTGPAWGLGVLWMGITLPAVLGWLFVTARVAK